MLIPSLKEVNVMPLKGGSLRWNPMGKRADFSARTVFTDDQNLVGQSGSALPMLCYVVYDTGERIDLRYNKRADTLLTLFLAYRLAHPD
jgi:hypothetical protein